MKLLLCSWGPNLNTVLEKAFLDLLSKPINENKVFLLSIDTTSEFHVEQQAIAIKWYKQIGFQEQNISIYNLITGKIPSFEDLDVLHMSGGNTFQYLQGIRENGLVPRIREFIKRDGVYVGSSAGSILMGPDVDDNLTIDVNENGLEDVTGFGYTDFYLLVHWDTIFEELHTDAIKYSWDTGKRVISLTDQQAVLVQDDGFKIISP